MQDDTLRHEFTHQSESFGESDAARAAETLGSLLELVPSDEDALWLEAACGPGAISRALAARVGAVHGVDLTEAMVETARSQASAAGLANVTFSVGDVAALELGDDSFDGAVTRFSLHHIPRPGRVLSELARVVRPGGSVIVADHLTDPDRAAAAWHQEIERLRDPSHWTCLTLDEMRALGTGAGLQLERDEVIPIDLDYDGWLGRGSGGPRASGLIEQSLDGRPQAAESFRVSIRDGERRLGLRYWLSRWTVLPR